MSSSGWFGWTATATATASVRAILPALLVLAAFATADTSANAATAPEEIEKKVAALLDRMTVEEKVGQLQQLSGNAKSGRSLEDHRKRAREGRIGSMMDVRGAGNVNEIQRIAVEESRLKIPVLCGFDVIHGYRTIFPIPLGLASTWDPATIERAARISAREASSAGVRWTFAPMLDVARDPRWGRIAEGPGEDPYLGAMMSRAWVRGFQGDDPSAPDRLLACAKHWVAYGAPIGGREYNTAEVSERTLRTVFFPPYKAALDAGVGTFMSALNDINGIPATANPFTLKTVLRDEWEFDGLVVSDFKAVEQLVAHGVAADAADAARLALSAGIDMEEKSETFSEHLPQLVASGKLPVATLDEAVRRVLRVKYRAGLFDRPYADEGSEQGVLLSSDHLDAAREVARRSLVLLKNDGDLLPIDPQAQSIALIGPLADDRHAPLGHWKGDGRADDVVTVLDGIQAKVGERPGMSLHYAQGCTADGDKTSGFDDAVQIARQADVAIVVVGEPAVMSGEAASRSTLNLPGRQLDLVKAVHATSTPTIVVLINGRPLSISWISEHVPAILEAWFPGTQGGHAIADALFGDANPGGKLPVTFPRTVGQVPIYYNHRNTGRPPTDFRYTSKYIDLPSSPLFPFGHGLSYTRFELSDLRLDAHTITPDGHLKVSVNVENVGDRDGDEVVQLYLHDLVASVARPVKQLRGFRRVTLRPGEKTKVQFTLGPEDLGFYNQQMRFVVEPGTFQVSVGTSSTGGLEDRFEVEAR